MTQVPFFEAVRPVERSVAVQMLDRSLVSWRALAPDVRSESTTTVRAGLELPSETKLYLKRNSELVRHGAV